MAEAKRPTIRSRPGKRRRFSAQASAVPTMRESTVVSPAWIAVMLTRCQRSTAGQLPAAPSAAGGEDRPEDEGDRAGDRQRDRRPGESSRSGRLGSIEATEVRQARHRPRPGCWR